jgi:hypothetical protein
VIKKALEDKTVIVTAGNQGGGAVVALRFAAIREAGIDPVQYAVDPIATPVKDIFLPGVDYELFGK